jgi:nucleotide-binding universal stress UspA family protein
MEVSTMKILLAVDGSPFSDVAVKEVAGRPWPPGSGVKILGCVHKHAPEIVDPMLIGYAAYQEVLEAERKRMHQVVGKAAEMLRERDSALKIETEVLNGSPKERILDVAKAWRANLIVVGSHGYGAVKKFLLGSVSQAVASHARCSVEIVRALSTDFDEDTSSETL